MTNVFGRLLSPKVVVEVVVAEVEVAVAVASVVVSISISFSLLFKNTTFFFVFDENVHSIQSYQRIHFDENDK